MALNNLSFQTMKHNKLRTLWDCTGKLEKKWFNRQFLPLENK
jgi:hypothetical protein